MKKNTRMKLKPSASGKEGKLVVSRTRVWWENGEESEEVSEENEPITVRPFATDPVYVSVKKGFTKQPRRYESIRVDVSLTFPCYVEEAAQVYQEVSDKVEELLDEEYSKLEEQYG